MRAHAIEARQHRNLTYTTDEGDVRIFVEVQAQPPHLDHRRRRPHRRAAGLHRLAMRLRGHRPGRPPPIRQRGALPARRPRHRRPVPRRAAHPARIGPGFDPNTYIVLVTRGHQHDVDCLVEVLDDPLAYIGMIGSQRRIQAVFELLESEQGIAPEPTWTACMRPSASTSAHARRPKSPSASWPRSSTSCAAGRPFRSASRFAASASRPPRTSPHRPAETPAVSERRHITEMDAESHG